MLDAVRRGQQLFCSQQDNAPVRSARNSVQLLQRETLNLPSFKL